MSKFGNKTMSIKIAVAMMQESLKAIDPIGSDVTASELFSLVGLGVESAFSLFALIDSLKSMSDEEREKAVEQLVLVIESELLEQAEDTLTSLASTLSEISISNWKLAIESRDSEIEKLKDGI